jgi:hypothetical protein
VAGDVAETPGAHQTLVAVTVEDARATEVQLLMAAAAGSKGTGQANPSCNTHYLHRFSFWDRNSLLGTGLAIAAQCRQVDFLGFVQHAVQALAADAQGLGRVFHVAAGRA